MMYQLIIIFTSIYFTTAAKLGNDFVYPGNYSIKIIGGDEAEPGQFPYQVALEVEGLFSSLFCGGSLISKNYVLTSANCIIRGITANVILGAHDIDNKLEPSRKVIKSSEMTPHENYDSSHFLNDIGLVKLPEPVEETDYIKIVQLPQGSDSYANTEGVISGWGVTKDESDSPSPVLRYVESKVLSNPVCANIDPFGTILDSSHMCLSGDGNIGACTGDTGGPLVVNGVQVGVFSFSYRYCTVGKPSVFTRLTKFKDWIAENSDLNW